MSVHDSADLAPHTAAIQAAEAAGWTQRTGVPSWENPSGTAWMDIDNGGVDYFRIDGKHGPIVDAATLRLANPQLAAAALAAIGAFQEPQP